MLRGRKKKKDALKGKRELIGEGNTGTRNIPVQASGRGKKGRRHVLGRG